MTSIAQTIFDSVKNDIISYHGEEEGNDRFLSLFEAYINKKADVFLELGLYDTLLMQANMYDTLLENRVTTLSLEEKRALVRYVDKHDEDMLLAAKLSRQNIDTIVDSMPESELNAKLCGYSRDYIFELATLAELPLRSRFQVAMERDMVAFAYQVDGDKKTYLGMMSRDDRDDYLATKDNNILLGALNSTGSHLLDMDMEGHDIAKVTGLRYSLADKKFMAVLPISRVCMNFDFKSDEGLVYETIKQPTRSFSSDKERSNYQKSIVNKYRNEPEISRNKGRDR